MNRRVTVFGSRSLALAAVVVLSACGGSSGSSTASTDSVPTTDAVADASVWPLLGTPVEDSAAASRPAMVVKIDNHPSARPQAGINQADIIFEENVEKLTRYAAVFHSEGSDPVGPIRSGRFQDINLLGIQMVVSNEAKSTELHTTCSQKPQSCGHLRQWALLLRKLSSHIEL